MVYSLASMSGSISRDLAVSDVIGPIEAVTTFFKSFLASFD